MYKYADSDDLQTELAEWYTYSEEPEFVWNINAFTDVTSKKFKNRTKWFELDTHEKQTHLIEMLNETDNANKEIRVNNYRAILYLVQGVYDECESIDDYYRNVIDNVVLVYESGGFWTFIDLFLFEINNASFRFEENSANNCKSDGDSTYAPCISDNNELRIILSVIYTIIEVVRCYEIEIKEKRINDSNELDKKMAKIKTSLTDELSN
jgi:hypothetical protein